MATVYPTIAQVPSPGDLRGWVITWPNMNNGDVGATIDLPHFGDRSVQVEGTFGVGGNVQMQGSNDGVHLHALHDHFGTMINIAAAAVAGISEMTWKMAPAVTNGDGTTSLTVSAFIRRTNP